MKRRILYQHTLLDPPIHTGLENVTIQQLAGSTLGRFIFTTHQPAIQVTWEGSFLFKNVRVLGDGSGAAFQINHSPELCQ